MKTDFAWSQECDYISNVTDKCLHSPLGERHSAMRNFGHDKACFITYCEMQRDSATRDGKHDSAQYIQHCLDDLDASQWVVMVGAQFIVYPMVDGVVTIESKPVLGSIEQATRFTSRRRAIETALKSSAVSGLHALAVRVRDAQIINHETP